MAFLDNSGDIILDAVLTETGRRKMANGDFSITKFALGDDEIDYSLYDKNHPSGSAYYDLEILQTPIFEAFTQINAGINYGLLSTTATDLLYLPTMHSNSLAAVGGNNISPHNGMFYVQDTSNNSTGIEIGPKLTAQSIESMEGNTAASNYVLLETGLNTGFSNVPVGTAANRVSYLVGNGLVDRSVYVYYDNRFISGIMGISSTSTFSADGDTKKINISTTAGTSTSIASLGLANYSAASVNAITNGVVWSSSPNTEATYSVIGGPRANALLISPVIKVGLDAEYTLYGTTGHVVGTTTTKYIDTTIYVQSVTSPAQIQIPIRIITIQ